MKPTFMGASTKQGYEIAAKSREIVRSLIDEKTKDLTSEERSIVERIVHSTADPEYADITRMSSDFVQQSLEAVSQGKDILTDISMVKAGINKYPGNIYCYISDERAVNLAREQEITRAAAAMELAAVEGFEGVVVIGNAPTALWKVMELVEAGSMNVKSVIGVPVGFVGAAESKKALAETLIPHLVTEGPKGGTPVAVAAINSLINISRNER
ncbi:cobalt-precorrin-8 methylmutase [Methanobacterium formicicum]|uniref:Cobalt-precorrin-8X methylmutase n=1 Tax=Methanobacterium formicicum TaxID=2162 RepID=A0A089ZIG8_METFO|nr:cobalt-precorrin-8 methylmutase [Methanobacterium formicicum]AIS32443.1 precorrin-8X methylmutase CbiC [Methanobacterium formicicum]CEL24321.1 Cobalt-precorrin-8X methylmutase [Methanobacterium formicicum]